MDRIVSLEHFNDLVLSAKSNGCKLSNCFFLPTVIERLIGNETLYYQDLANGLLILDDNQNFYRCYYYLSGNDQPERLALNKSAVMEFPFNGVLKDAQIQQIKLIEAMGFRLGRESGLMAASVEQLTDAHLDSGGHGVCRTPEEKDAGSILKMLNEAFNPLYAFLPSEAELTNAIHEKRVIAIYSGERIAAALISSVEKKAATVNQIVVDPDYRRRGLGRRLMSAYHDQYRHKVVSFRHWVDLNNKAAVNMYLGLGYGISLRKANEYIMLNEEGE